MTELERAARLALEVLLDWQKNPVIDLELGDWPIRWLNNGEVSVTLTPRLLANGNRSKVLNATQRHLGKTHNMAIGALQDALAKTHAIQHTHAEGCWSWGPQHYMCAYNEIGKLRGWREK